MSGSRYTSAALSRELAEAGARQEGAEAWYCKEHGFFAGLPSCFGRGVSRAFRLDELLEELERLNPGEWTLNTCPIGYAAYAYGQMGERIDGCVDPESIVEAAGRLVLAVLREGK